MTPPPVQAPDRPLVDYDWAVLRAVPRVHLGASVNVAVVLHARTAGYLGMRAITDPSELARRVPGVDAGLLARYLEACTEVCVGGTEVGDAHASVALAPPSERFHWLTAPRSDVLQASPVHGGVSHDPAETLDRLFREQVLGDRAPDASGDPGPARPPEP